MTNDSKILDNYKLNKYKCKNIFIFYNWSSYNFYLELTQWNKLIIFIILVPTILSKIMKAVENELLQDEILETQLNVFVEEWSK